MRSYFQELTLEPGVIVLASIYIALDDVSDEGERLLLDLGEADIKWLTDEHISIDEC